MSRDNTARQYLLLVTPREAVREVERPTRRDTGRGLLLAVVVSLTLWAGLIWIASEAVRAFSSALS